MPVVIEELRVAVDLLNRKIGPLADPLELGRKVAELEARLQALETAIVVGEKAVTITAERVTIHGDIELVLQGSVSSIQQRCECSRTMRACCRVCVAIKN